MYHIHDPSENHFRDVTIVTSIKKPKNGSYKLVTAETTLVLQSPTIVGLGVNMHGRLGSLLKVHRTHKAHTAVIRRALVAITDVQAVVSVHAIVQRDDHAESGVTGRVNAQLSRTHVVASPRSGIPSGAQTSADGIQFIVT